MHRKQKVYYICKQGFSTDDIKYQRVRDNYYYTGKYRGATHDISNLRYKTQKGFPAVFYNCSKYDYHFIIKMLIEEFEGQFDCFGKKYRKIHDFFGTNQERTW